MKLDQLVNGAINVGFGAAAVAALTQLDDVDIVLGSDGLERVDDRLLGLGLDHCGTSIHTKKKRGRNPTSFNYNFICKQTIPIPAETRKCHRNPQVSVPTASPQE
jgi:hypothetical protein